MCAAEDEDGAGAWAAFPPPPDEGDEGDGSEDDFVGGAVSGDGFGGLTAIPLSHNY